MEASHPDLMGSRRRNMNRKMQRAARRRLVVATSAVIEALEERKLLSDDISNSTITGWYGTWSCGHPTGSTPPILLQPPAKDQQPGQSPCNCNPEVSKKPVRYGDGKPLVSSEDLVSHGLGGSFGIVRTWGDLTNSGLVGPGWVFDGLPYLVQVKDAQNPGKLIHVSVVSSGFQQRWYDVRNSSSNSEPTADGGGLREMDPIEVVEKR